MHQESGRRPTPTCSRARWCPRKRGMWPTGKQRDTSHTRRSASSGREDVDVTSSTQQFASDNYAGICPEAWAEMERANGGRLPPTATTNGPSAPPTPSGACSKRTARSFRVQWHGGQLVGSFGSLPIVPRHLRLVGARGNRRVRGSRVLLQRIEAARRAPDRDQLTPAIIRAMATGRSDIHFPNPGW